MIYKSEEIEKLFQEIDQKINEKIKVFIIGGAALLFEGLKASTKDIDIIIENRDELKSFEKALISLNFKAELPNSEYKKMELNQILVRNDFRIDVFHKNVCRKLHLSEKMMKRSKVLLQLENIQLLQCSKEDIFLFKTMTDREGDLDDCISLIKKGLDWTIIENEIINQIDRNGEAVWITWIGERLDQIMDKGFTIPIMKEVNKRREKYFNQLERHSKK